MNDEPKGLGGESSTEPTVVEDSIMIPAHFTDDQAAAFLHLRHCDLAEIHEVIRELGYNVESRDLTNDSKTTIVEPPQQQVIKK